MKEVFSPYQIEWTREPDWWGVYVIGQRLASRYQDKNDRVFIVGDACELLHGLLAGRIY